MALNDLVKKLYSKRGLGGNKTQENQNQNQDQAGGEPGTGEPAADGQNVEAEENSADFAFSRPDYSGYKDSGRTEEMIVQAQSRERRSFLNPRNKKILAIVSAVSLVLIIFIILGSWLFFRYKESAFSEEKVVIEISGQEEVKSAQEVTFDLVVRNENRVGLKDVSIRLEYPEDMEIKEEAFLQKQTFGVSKIQLGNLAARSQKEYKITFTPFGPRDQQAFLNATISYMPENFSSVFQKGAQKSLVIKSSSVRLTLITTEEAANGEDVSLEIIVKNESANAQSEVSVEVDYPNGFVFKRSEPAAADSHNETWDLGALAAEGQKKITIIGAVEGEKDTVKNFQVRVGKTRGDQDFLVFTEAEDVIRMVGSRIELVQKVNKEAVYPGDAISYSIYFTNTSDVALRDLVLTAQIEGEMFREEDFNLDDGYYNDADNTITWKASDVSELKLLKPGQGGKVDFFVPTFSQVPAEDDEDQNFKIVCQAEIESLDVASALGQNKKISSVPKEVRFNSKLILDASVSFEHDEISNSGPVPLKSGQETTLAITFEVENTSNELEDVVLKTSLPSGISWKDNYLPERSDIDYNERTNELEWKIGKVKPGTGFYRASERLSFQIGVTPSINQVEETVQLLNDFEIKATDTFTENQIEYTFSGLNSSEIPNSDLGKVQAPDEEQTAE